MGPLILDTSVLIGLLDSADSHHARAVDAVDQADRDKRQLLAPASAYGEALIAFARANRVKDARDAIARMGIIVVPLTGPIAERAAELRAAHGSLRLPDAVVLATAREHDGNLLTYDDRLASHRATIWQTLISESTARGAAEKGGRVRCGRDSWRAAAGLHRSVAGQQAKPSPLSFGFLCSVDVGFRRTATATASPTP